MLCSNGRNCMIFHGKSTTVDKKARAKETQCFCETESSNSAYKNIRFGKLFPLGKIDLNIYVNITQSQPKNMNK